MAAITPATVVEVNLGGTRLLICKFTAMSTGDTWTSGVKGVLAHWADATSQQATQASAGVNATLTTASTGVFTFKPGEDAVAATLFVIGSK